MNKYVVKGGLYAGLSFVLAIVEAVTHHPPRIELFVGYGLVFAFGVFTIVTRQLRHDASPKEQKRRKE